MVPVGEAGVVAAGGIGLDGVVPFGIVVGLGLVIPPDVVVVSPGVARSFSAGVVAPVEDPVVSVPARFGAVLPDVPACGSSQPTSATVPARMKSSSERFMV